MARNRRKRQDYQDAGESQGWLASYAGLATVLIVLLVFLFTVSQINVPQYAPVADAFSMLLTGEAISAGEEATSPVSADRTSSFLEETLSANQEQLAEVKDLIEEFVAEEELARAGSGGLGAELGQYIRVYEQERGLVISIKDTLLFRGAGADLNPQALSIIRQVGTSLVDLPNYIRVEGHTDNSPVVSDDFASNWELSVLRALKLLDILNGQAQIPAERLAVSGYGEFRPLLPNDSPANRASNRRVDIVVLKTQYDYFEPPRGGG